jgi:hypothetical protein
MRRAWAGVAAFALAGAVIGREASAAPAPASASAAAEGGTISIEIPSTDGSSGTPPPASLDAVSKALTDRGFTVFEDSGHAASVVELVVSRSDVGTSMARVRGEGSPSMAGAGLAVPLGTGDSQQVPLRRTRLEMRFHRRGNPAIVWDGAAVTVREAGSAKGSDATVAADLSRALLSAYPVQPNEVLGVP